MKDIIVNILTGLTMIGLAVLLIKWQVKRAKRPRKPKKARPKTQRQLVAELQGKEIECRCEACGHFWCYGQKELLETIESNKFKRTTAMATIGGNKRALSYNNPHQAYEYFDKCPGCGSRRIKKNEINIA